MARKAEGTEENERTARISAAVSLWAERDMSGVSRELNHPADVWLEIRAPDLAGLFENALFALYSQIADLQTVRSEEEAVIEVCGDAVDTALRSLLSEALFRFETEAFLAAGAEVKVETTAGDDRPPVKATAHLWGEPADSRRHVFHAEVKAITYHQLTAEKTPEGDWRATVLLDV